MFTFFLRKRKKNVKTEKTQNPVIENVKLIRKNSRGNSIPHHLKNRLQVWPGGS